MMKEWRQALGTPAAHVRSLALVTSDVSSIAMEIMRDLIGVGVTTGLPSQC